MQMSVWRPRLSRLSCVWNRACRGSCILRHVRPRAAMSGWAIWKQESERVKTEEGYLMTEDGFSLFFTKGQDVDLQP